MDNRNNKLPEFFLPDFCRVQSIFMVVLIGELLAVIFTLLTSSDNVDLSQSLGLYSISIQWVLLVSVGILCLLRPSLAGLRDLYAGIISLTIILTVTFFYTYISVVVYFGLHFDPFATTQQHFLTKNMIISGLIGSVMLRYFYLQQQYRKQVLLESSARLDALQARIRPHFLFNSMNVIASLTRIDPKMAETAIEDLSDLIRATLDNKKELIPLELELQNGKRYMSIEKLRLGERLKVKWEIEEESLSVLVPPLSVQPMLENAVYHGIQVIPEGGEVVVEARMNGKVLTVKVSNPIYGETEHRGHGIALNNIAQRLDVIFKGRASLQKLNQGDVYVVTIKIPSDQNTERRNQ